jgi:DNA invertase Pin-like site-specific DNA recombinase
MTATASTTSKPRAYSYLRFSTPEQAQGDSARRQIDLATRYAATHGLALDDTLRLHDEGISGFRGANVRRGALGQFLKAVDDGDVPEGSFLLVENLDRLSRQNPWDAFPLFQQIIGAGVTVVTLFDGKVYSQEDLRANPMRILESLFVMVRANEESETKSRRGKAVWGAKRGRASTKPLTSMLPSWLKMVKALDGRDGKVEVVPERVEVVRRIVTSFLAGTGQQRIAEALNTERVPVFGDGTMWHRSFVSKVLSNPALIGTYAPHEMTYDAVGRRIRKPLPQPPVEGYYPAIISQEEWEDLSAIHSRNTARQPQHRRGVQNILAGLAECPLCGSTMTRVFKRAGSNAKLVCVRAKQGAGCQYVTIDLPTLETAIREGLPRVLDSAPSGDPEADTAVDLLRYELEGFEAGLSHLIDELQDRGRSPALSTAIAHQEALKAQLEAKLDAAIARQTRASPASQERRRRELLAALQPRSGPLRPLEACLGATAEVLNVRLRGTFARVLPDWRDGRVRFRWTGGEMSGVEVMFAWPKGEN